PRWKTPVVAIAIYGTLIMLYIASGTGFERLTRYMILGFLPFVGLVAIAPVVTAGAGRLFDAALSAAGNPDAGVCRLRHRERFCGRLEIFGRRTWHHR